jgi:hypothetical protein
MQEMGRMGGVDRDLVAGGIGKNEFFMQDGGGFKTARTELEAGGVAWVDPDM